jgi:GntR family transcriptional regulator, transcriptional repressor for pyruvate dehydrogenase complex
LRKTLPRNPIQPGSSSSGLAALQSKIRPISRTSVSDEIIDQIMSLIANGDLKPGQRLTSERELCKIFQIGRPSLREAIRALCIVGVLQARVGDGTSVSADGNKFIGKIVEWRLITEQHDIENLMEVRIALEGLAAAQAARNPNPAFMGDLLKILTHMKAAVEAKNRQIFVELDLKFHITIASAAQNDLLLDLVSMIRSQISYGLSLVAAHPRSLPLTLKEHGIIVQALKKRDPKEAAVAMQHHLELSRKRYREAVHKLSLAIPSKPAHLDSSKSILERSLTAPR